MTYKFESTVDLSEYEAETVKTYVCEINQTEDHFSQLIDRLGPMGVEGSFMHAMGQLFCGVCKRRLTTDKGVLGTMSAIILLTDKDKTAATWAGICRSCVKQYGVHDLGQAFCERIICDVNADAVVVAEK